MRTRARLFLCMEIEATGCQGEGLVRVLLPTRRILQLCTLIGSICFVFLYAACDRASTGLSQSESGGIAATEVPDSNTSADAPNDEAEGGEPSAAAGFPDIVGFPDNDNGFDEELIALLAADDFDKDGASDLEELEEGTDPEDASDGGDLDGDEIPDFRDDDVDGDGLLDGEDVDVDGDGTSNASDEDVDGDNTENGKDPDIDGDGIENREDEDADGDELLVPEDPDDDGDGLNDDEDDDDDADGKEDCECKHGLCSSIGDICYCEPGWKGEDCDEFHCKDVRNCNNGTCTGPNTCRCNQGWDDVGTIPCVAYHCRGLSNCFDHGNCIGPDICECDEEWKGRPDCSQRTCVAVPSVCNDSDPCTKDECSAATGCKHPPLCGSNEICSQGTCFPKCRNTKDCNSGNACRDGACQDGCFEESECRDGDPCTTDTCNASSDCENELITCPGAGETCVRGRCVRECVDDDACDTGQSCHDAGCFADCDDNTPCSGDDETCESGVCVPPEDDSEDGN